MRKIEVLENGKYKQIEFEQLKKGDIFKVTDICDKPFEDGTIIRKCVSDVTIGKNGEPGVEAEIQQIKHVNNVLRFGKEAADFLKDLREDN